MPVLPRRLQTVREMSGEYRVAFRTFAFTFRGCTTAHGLLGCLREWLTIIEELINGCRLHGSG